MADRSAEHRDFFISRAGENAAVAIRTAETLKLAATLGFLPLALDHAAADCRRTGIAFDRYRGLAAELIRDVPRGADYAEETPVFATFELAIRKAAGTCPAAETLHSWVPDMR